MKIMGILLLVLAVENVGLGMFGVGDLGNKGKGVGEKQTGRLFGDPIKYNGKGFDANLIATLSQAINDAAIFYTENYTEQAKFVSKRMKQQKSGDWNIAIVKNLSIVKITDVSTQLYYFSQNDTWALWYDGSSYLKQILHLVVYNGDNGKTDSIVTTQKTSSGSNVPPSTKNVIDSIVKTLNTSQDIAKYIEKYDGQKWSVLAIPFKFPPPIEKFPESYACLSVSDVYMSYHGTVQYDGVQYSLMIFV